MTPNKRDLKAYVRFDGTGRIVPGSLVLRRTKPKNGNWKQIEAYECCVPSTACVDPVTMIIQPIDGYFEFGMRVASGNTVKGTIEWGDGTSEPFDLSSYSWTAYLSHSYTTPGYIPITMKIYFTSVAGFENLEIGVGDVNGEVLSITGLQRFIGSTIEEVDADGTAVNSLDVSGLPILSLYALSCPNLQFLNVQGCTNLQDTQLFADNFGILDFTGCTSLYSAEVFDNANMQNLIIDGCPNLVFLDGRNCALTEAAIDAALINLENNGLSYGVVDFRGGTNAPPSVAGAAAQANLIGKGWTALTN